ncbi:YfhJ family protein [Lederbergia citrea]|uniref:YfhJ family protein n=1 Tax=Lederbergia citrea TaxID=2833581 RepID=A0A942Z4L8_9BACI|nr:YfhJ family protein [Lederbergia citrea]MBS4179118.1 YfhJ family protein [Lederbergia citrea]MBS4205778.1 YfhJ family protein [Lederbergia citrea]MBS4224773.1 YfhJ family protein [Lederbergia citrea]
MNDYHERLAEYLLEKNPNLSASKARTWVELFWDDFETTYAKAGRKYRGPEMAERVVRSWINQYGDKLHEFAALNPKYAHMLNEEENEK